MANSEGVGFLGLMLCLIRQEGCHWTLRWETRLRGHLPDLITGLPHDRMRHSITECVTKCVHVLVSPFKRHCGLRESGDLYNAQTVKSRSDCQ